LVLLEVTVDDLLDHRAWALENIAATSYNKHRRHLRALLNFAVNEQLIARSPLAKVSSAPCAARRPKVVPSTWYNQACKKLNCDRVQGLNSPAFWKLVFTVIHFTGTGAFKMLAQLWRSTGG
jgi:site-specific recombinase XerD